MSKKVYFYKVGLVNEADNQPGDYKNIKDILIRIIDEKSTECESFKAVDLTRDEDLHYTADVFEYCDDILFARLSSQKPTGSYLYRDYSTNVPNALLEGSSEDKEGIEIYTYVLLNYETGILTFLSQKGAPSVNTLNYLFAKYNPSYSLKLTKIPNADGIDFIYQASESHISQIEIEAPVPDAAALEQIFHWKPQEILDAQTLADLKVTVRLSVSDRRSMTKTDIETRGVIDGLKAAIGKYRKARVRAKAKNIKTQDYNLFEEYYNYSVDIPTYKVVNYHKIYYTANELVQIFREHLLMAYTENINLLRSITNR